LAASANQSAEDWADLPALAVCSASLTASAKGSAEVGVALGAIAAASGLGLGLAEADGEGLGAMEGLGAIATVELEVVETGELAGLGETALGAGDFVGLGDGVEFAWLLPWNFGPSQL
jgi:hypothetical protein